MRWLEEIRVRTPPRREKEVEQVLLDMAASVRENGQIKSARVYYHHSSPGGFTLVLVWETGTVPVHGSETAMLILEGLKPLGLLDHVVLVPRERKAKAEEASKA